LEPVQIEISDNFKDISCGETISGAITDDNRLYLWGFKPNLPKYYKDYNITDENSND
jgi:alpha-tubulin suppressor-like RCC1 family protein